MFRVNLPWKPLAVQDFHNWNISFWSPENIKNLQGQLHSFKVSSSVLVACCKNLQLHQTSFKHKLLLSGSWHYPCGQTYFLSCKEQSSSLDHKAVHGLVYNLEHFKFSQFSLWHPGHRPSLCYFIANILLSSSNTCNYALPQVLFFADNKGKKLPKASYFARWWEISFFSGAREVREET